jgi:hypothetical protein
MKKTREQMGSLYKSHSSWFVRYYEKEGNNQPIETATVISKRKTQRLGSVTELTPSQALDKMREYMRNLGYLGYSSKSRLTVREFYETWYLPNAKARIPDSVHGIESHWRTHLAHRMGQFSVRQFTTSDAQDVLDDIFERHKDTLAHETYKRIRTTMSGICRFAVKKRLCHINPIRDTDVRDFGRRHGRKTEALDMDEVFRYMQLIPSRAPLFATLAFAALRPGEAEGLQAASYDGRFLRIAHAVSDHTGLGSTKTGEDEVAPGVIPVIPLLKDLLDPIAPREGFFFKNSQGAHSISPTSLIEKSVRSWKAQGCAGKDGTHFGVARRPILHDLGIPPEVACLVLRNSEQVVKRHYIKLDTEMHKRKAMERLGRAVAKRWEAFGKQSHCQQAAM